jgi:peroxiredoxin
MSKRNTYLLGGAAIAVGITMIIIAIAALSGGGDSNPGAPETTAREGPTAPAEGEAPGRPAVNAHGRSLSRAVAERRRAQAPAFAVEVIEKGSPPAQAGELEQAVAGGSLALARLRGSPVVLHMWSPGCGPCGASARLVETTWQRWGRRGIAFVGISVGGSEEDGRDFAGQYDLTYPIVRDGAGRIADAYGVTSLPAIFFVSSTGDIVGSVTGSPTVRQMELGTAAARAGRAFGSEQGRSREARR